ncbi:MAG: deoxyribose-phosphate aldolase [Spirochaetales bacterium]|nr:deoxyribose-phosphate aldolase [Spirochaetales bacterium]
MKISKYIDHTVLAADADEKKIEKLCQEARDNDFASVCVNTCWVKKCAELLKGTDVNVCTVVGFPLGAMDTEAKAFEAALAVKNGATEVDMVLNVGYIKSGMYAEAEEDIRKVKEACDGKLLKVILETCLLTKEEIVKASELSMAAGADYVKTSTGFSKGGATAEDVALMRKTVGDKLGVKASGGIRDYETAMKMIEAGASRLGCSAGIAIINGASSDAEY